MAFEKLLDFQMTLRAIDLISGVIKGVEERIGKLNEAVKATSRYREAAENFAMIGVAVAGMGAAIALPLKSFVESAASVDAAMRHLDTVLDSGVAGIRERAQALSLARDMSVKFNVSQEDIINNLYKSYSFIGDWNAAVANTTASLSVAKGALGDFNEIGAQTAIFFNDFGDKAKDATAQINHFGDLIAYTARHGAFGSVNELMAGVSEGIGAAKAAGVGAEDLLAMAQGYSAIGLRGAQAGTAITEAFQAFARGNIQRVLGTALVTFNNGALDAIGSAAKLTSQFKQGAITLEQFQRGAKALGIRGERLLAVNTDDLVKFRRDLGNPDLVKGAAMQGALTVLAGFNEQMGILLRKLDVVKEAFGAQLLGPIQAMGAALSPIIDSIGKFAEAHPRIVKFVALFAAISAAALITVGAIAGLAAGVLFVGSIILASPIIAWAIGIGVALAAVVAAFAAFAPRVGGAILKVIEFLAMLPVKAFESGYNVVAMLAKGIWSAATLPARAMESVVKKIRGYLPFSPAKEGPLRDLHRVRIIETIAESMKPTAAIASIRRVATAVAIGGAVVTAPAIAMAAPGAFSGGRSGAVVVNIHYAPVISAGAGSSDVATLLREHARELVDTVKRELEKRERAEF